jgi:hypothetical protein
MKTQNQLIQEAYVGMVSESKHIEYDDGLEEHDDNFTPKEKLEILKNPNIDVNKGAVHNTNNVDVLVAVAKHPTVNHRTLHHLADKAGPMNKHSKELTNAIMSHKNLTLGILRKMTKSTTAAGQRIQDKNYVKFNGTGTEPNDIGTTNQGRGGVYGD